MVPNLRYLGHLVILYNQGLHMAISVIIFTIQLEVFKHADINLIRLDAAVIKSQYVLGSTHHSGDP